ncbi:MAG: hypothetical protein RBG13Loki_0680 [Promethearchaeota archaeon CR_4]|nr:MAG: hypothetical protein RBG13Loki_0680 [Candidatus Lokiarchaeota archaeon CR_4]
MPETITTFFMSRSSSSNARIIEFIAIPMPHPGQKIVGSISVFRYFSRNSALEGTLFPLLGDFMGAFGTISGHLLFRDLLF